MWCMRFEAKHNFFKETVKNFKNLIKSLVKQHQRQLAFTMKIIILSCLRLVL